MRFAHFLSISTFEMPSKIEVENVQCLLFKVIRTLEPVDGEPLVLALTEYAQCAHPPCAHVKDELLECRLEIELGDASGNAKG